MIVYLSLVWFTFLALLVFGTPSNPGQWILKAFYLVMASITAGKLITVLFY